MSWSENGRIGGGKAKHMNEGEKRDQARSSHRHHQRPSHDRHFLYKDIEQLEEVLNKVKGLTDIEWRHTERGLEIDGLLDDGEAVVIGHPRSALAYLEAYILGYEHGKEDSKDG